MKDKQFKLFIDPYYRSLLPEQDYKARLALKLSIQREGMHTPITVASNGKILDGMTRFEIWEELGHKELPPYTIKPFNDVLDEEIYVVSANLHRRRLEPIQVYELFEKQIEMLTLKVRSERAKNMWRTKQGLKQPFDHEDYAQKYQRSLLFQIGEMTGLGTGQIEAIRYIKRHANDELLESVRHGTVSTNSAKVLLQNRTTEFKPVETKYSKKQPRCPLCSNATRGKRGCHVHKTRCCTVCTWGV